MTLSSFVQEFRLFIEMLIYKIYLKTSLIKKKKKEIYDMLYLCNHIIFRHLGRHLMMRKRETI